MKESVSKCWNELDALVKRIESGPLALETRGQIAEMKRLLTEIRRETGYLSVSKANTKPINVSAA